MAAKMVKVRSESVTVFARFVAFVVALVTLGIQLGVVSAEKGEMILGVITDPETAALASAVGTLIVTLLPSIIGWTSRDKELPDGVDIKDVEVKSEVSNVAEKRSKVARAARAASIVLLLVFASFAISACNCSANRSYAQMSMSQQRASGICTTHANGLIE